MMARFQKAAKAVIFLAFGIGLAVFLWFDPVGLYTVKAPGFTSARWNAIDMGLPNVEQEDNSNRGCWPEEPCAAEKESVGYGYFFDCRQASASRIPTASLAILLKWSWSYSCGRRSSVST